MINHQIALDMRKQPGRVPPRVTVRRGEFQTQKVTAALTMDGAAYTPSYQSARLCVLHADGTWARCAATLGTASASATIASEALNGIGRCRLAYFEFYSSNGYSETTEGFELVILANVDGSTDPSASYSDELDALYRKWSAYETKAEQQENARVAAEAKRDSNEKSRLSSEVARANNEVARVTAEAKRHDEHIADQQVSFNAAAAANGAASRAEAAANQALQIANSVSQGSAGDSDVAELRSQNALLATMLADATGKFIFMGGTVYAPSSKASYSNGTVALGSTCSVSGTMIVLE